MSCFNPNKISVSLDRDTGSLSYSFLGPAKFDDPHEFGNVKDLDSRGSYSMLVPCGKCLGCRIDYSRDWANRMILELQDSPDAIFLTLTYNNSHLPRSSNGSPSLCKRDLQLFWKRLRKAFPGKKIRYFVAGEYGPKTYRPHYHAIVYGLSLQDFPDIVQHGCNELKDPYFISKILESLWGNGFILFSSVTWKTCAYVARYVLKKQYKGDEEFDSFIEPEFCLSSRRPGIGMNRAYEMVSSGHTQFSVDGRDGVHDVSLPKSFLKNLRNSDLSQEVADLCFARSIDAHDRLISNLDLFQVPFLEFLDNKERRLLRKFNVLPERSEF